MSLPLNDMSIASPIANLIRCASEPLPCWREELRDLGIVCNEAEALSFWNLLSLIYALTEEERVTLRATDAYALAGGSTVKGKRKFSRLVRAGAIIAAINPAKRNEKLISVSEAAKGAVLRTLDRMAREFEADAVAYRHYREIVRAS